MHTDYWHRAGWPFDWWAYILEGLVGRLLGYQLSKLTQQILPMCSRRQFLKGGCSSRAQHAQQVNAVNLFKGSPRVQHLQRADSD